MKASSDSSSDSDSDCDDYSSCLKTGTHLKGSPEQRATCLTAIRSLFLLDKLPLTQLANVSKNKLLKVSPKDPPVNFEVKNFVDDVSARLNAIRKVMNERGFHGYVVPSEDAHGSEYVAIRDERRAYVSAFTGSAGVALITRGGKAALSTDARYWAQARLQLPSDWTLLRAGIDESWQEWLAETVAEEAYLARNNVVAPSAPTVAVDAKLVSWSGGQELLRVCHANNVNFVADTDDNIVDVVRRARSEVATPPPGKGAPLAVHGLRYCGKTVEDKIAMVRESLASMGASAYVASRLDGIAWLLNARGAAVPYSPLFLAYLVVTADSIVLYTERNEDMHNYFSRHGIEIRSYARVWEDTLPSDGLVVLDRNASYALYCAVPAPQLSLRSILEELKGVKNKVEAANIRISQLADSVAIVRCLAWVHRTVTREDVFEMDVVRKLDKYRKEGGLAHYCGPSFATIAAAGANAAIVHYEPSPKHNNKLRIGEVLLLDSGGQYFEGTTDITRTVMVGQTKDKLISDLRKRYTLVLAGHISVAQAVFARDADTIELDTLARQPLSKEGMSYGHGTGHGIDNYGSVHAGPAGLAPAKTSYAYMPLQAGSFISDEPGCYVDGKYGVRIESDLLVVESDDGNDKLKFEYCTLVPFCEELIDDHWLLPGQREWITEYHCKIWESVGKELERLKDWEALEWLRERTQIKA